LREVITSMRREVTTASLAFRDGVSSLGNVDATSRTVTEALTTIHLAIARMDELTRAVRESAQSNRESVKALDEQVTATTTHAEAQAASSEMAARGGRGDGGGVGGSGGDGQPTGRQRATPQHPGHGILGVTVTDHSRAE
jgi:hypothetical protein